MTRRTRVRGPRRPARDQRGAVTAELAMALPLLLAVTTGLVWLLSLGTAQVRVVDAARETARAVARGDDAAAARDLGRRIAPEGARIEVSVSGARVVVSAAARVRGPGGLFAHLPGVDVEARSVALAEQG
jgi:Flp pilus assembly protein TadG